jgi:hypothetical protein
MLGRLSNYTSDVLNTPYVNIIWFTYTGKKLQGTSVVPTSPAESQFVLTPLSYFTGKKERKQIKILLSTDTSYNSRNRKFINGLKNIQDAYSLINEQDKISTGHFMLQINLRISAFSYVRCGSNGAKWFQGALLVVGKVLRISEKFMYSCQVR